MSRSICCDYGSVASEGLLLDLLQCRFRLGKSLVLCRSSRCDTHICTFVNPRPTEALALALKVMSLGLSFRNLTLGHALGYGFKGVRAGG